MKSSGPRMERSTWDSAAKCTIARGYGHDAGRYPAGRGAIAGHRRRRARRFRESVLENIAGLGPARRRALLTHFGGLPGVLRAGVADLERVTGVGTALARTLYDHLHPGA